MHITIVFKAVQGSCCFTCIHVFAAEVDTYFMHHPWERVHIVQVMSHWMVTNMQIILSKVSQAIVDNHFSSTTT
jgi:hypothetical protein